MTTLLQHAQAAADAMKELEDAVNESGDQNLISLMATVHEKARICALKMGWAIVEPGTQSTGAVAYSGGTDKDNGDPDDPKN